MLNVNYLGWHYPPDYRERMGAKDKYSGVRPPIFRTAKSVDWLLSVTIALTSGESAKLTVVTFAPATK